MGHSGRGLPRLAAIWATTALAALACAGCQARFTRENYDTIYVSQPAEEVHRVLGPPARSTPEHWDYVNRKPVHYEARVWIRDGHVVRKEWFNRRELFDAAR